MKPIKVALVHNDNPRAHEHRSVGIWSYEVPEFQVTHFPQQQKHFTIDTNAWVGRFDIVVQEDHKCYGTYINPLDMPLFYYVVDSTLSADHLANRLKQAQLFDVIMVDWDRLENFEWLGKETWRVSHCVNDKLFKNYGEEKTVDVGFHCMLKGPGACERRILVDQLTEFCEKRGYIFDCGNYGGEAYARAFNREKITIQTQRNKWTRAHRTFDALSCHTCLVTDTLPHVSDELRTAGVHYLEFRTVPELYVMIDNLLETDQWKIVAERGVYLIQDHHTWSVRAKQLHAKMAQWLGWLEEPWDVEQSTISNPD